MPARSLHFLALLALSCDAVAAAAPPKASLSLGNTAAPLTSVAVPRVHLSHTAAPLSLPRVMLGTGGGGGGYNVSSWLALGGTGFDSAITYCYNSAAPYCSHAAISFALLQAPQYASQVQVISKIEPETFGTLLEIDSFGMSVSRGILQDLSMTSIDVVMFHQAGRGQGNSNPRPPCFNASGAAAGVGTYADCRVATFKALQAVVEAGGAKSIAVSNWHQVSCGAARAAQTAGGAGGAGGDESDEDGGADGGP